MNFPTSAANSLPPEDLNVAPRSSARHDPVINADMYTPPEKGKPLPKANEDTRALLETIQRLGLDVSTHVGLHGGVGSADDLVKIVGQPATN